MDLPTAEDLNQRREDVGLTQSELADRAGVSQPLIARIEGGDVDPRLSTLRGIVNGLEAAEEDVVRAEDLMHESVISVAPDDEVQVAEKRMEEEAYSQLPVIENGIPVGSISHGDILSRGGSGGDIGDDSVREHMSEPFAPVSPDTPLDEIRNLLEHYKAVMVTEGGETVGIITEADVAARIT
jgi:predicted transcriptional regulator